MDLVNKFWNFCHTLRHEGVDYSDYIEELTYLLFLKLANEKDIEIPKGCGWSDIIVHDEENLLKKYNEVLSRLSKEKNILGDMFSQPMAKINSSSSLKKLLNLIDEVKWSTYNEDVLGSMFEGLLERAANESKKGAGQYFTPRPLIEAIVNVMKPDPFETDDFSITDVASGTGGFIISSYEWWKSKKLPKLSKARREKLFGKTYYGQELVVRPRRMAQMNLYLHGISPNIKLGDTIYEPLGDKKFSCILTNPPFGTKGSNQIPDRKDFKIKTSNKQLNFIQHVFSALEVNGRAALVLPDNALFEDKAADIWRILKETCNVHTILRLPNGTFSPYAQGVKANVVFLQKGLPTESVWVFDARNNVEGVTKKDRPLNEKHFNEFQKCYGSDPNGKNKRKDLGIDGRFREFKLANIEERNYNLNISWLHNESLDDENESKDPSEIAGIVISDLESVIEELKDIINILDDVE